MRRIGVLGLVVFATACASRSSSDGSAWQRCNQTLDIHPIEKTVASAEVEPLREALVGALSASTAPGDLRLRVRRDREATEVTVIASTLSDSITSGLARAVQRVLPAYPRDSTAPPFPTTPVDTTGPRLRGRSAFSLLLSTDGSQLTRLEGQSLPMCAPDLHNRDELAQIISRAARSVPNRGTVVMWMMVSEDGSVERVQVSRSSGDEVVDALGSTVGYAARFSPGTMDGEPMRVWVQLPVSIQ